MGLIEFGLNMTAKAKRRGTNLLLFVVLIVTLVGSVGLIALHFQTATQPIVGPPPADFPSGLTPDGYPYKGNPQAKVVIEEFADFQCPYCGRYAVEVAPKLDEKYVKTGQVYVVFRYFPFIGPESFRAAEAAACAAESGKFWEYQYVVFANQRGENRGWFSSDRLAEFARLVGLDVGGFQGCLGSGKYARFIQASAEQARKRGIRSTPTVVINGRTFEGLYDFATYDRYIGQLLGPG